MLRKMSFFTDILFATSPEGIIALSVVRNNVINNMSGLTCSRAPHMSLTFYCPVCFPRIFTHVTSQIFLRLLTVTSQHPPLQSPCLESLLEVTTFYKLLPSTVWYTAIGLGLDISSYSIRCSYLFVVCLTWRLFYSVLNVTSSVVRGFVSLWLSSPSEEAVKITAAGGYDDVTLCSG